MAKRVPPGERPYRPVDDALVRAVLNPKPTPPPDQAEAPAVDQPAAPPRLIGIQGRKDMPPVSESPPQPKVEELTREKRVLFTPTEAWELDRLVSDMAARLGTPLKSSHILRAAVMLLRHAEEELLKQSGRVGPLKRPPNNDVMALAAFEHYLAEMIDTALRNAARFR